MRIKEGYVLCESAGNNVVFREEEGGRSVGVLCLNDTGALLWKMLEKNDDPSALARKLCRDFGIPAERAKRDVIEFLGVLVEAGAVEK